LELSELPELDDSAELDEQLEPELPELSEL